jgi:hypothetical protein
MNKKMYLLFHSPHISTQIGHHQAISEKIKMVMVEIPEGKRPLGRPKRRWVDNIKMDLRGIG